MLGECNPNLKPLGLFGPPVHDSKYRGSWLGYIDCSDVLTCLGPPDERP